MSPFPNQMLNDNNRLQKPDFYQPMDDSRGPMSLNNNLHYFPLNLQDTASSTRTQSDDSSEQITDKGQYSDLNNHQWEEGGQSVFDGIELPVITEANLYIKNIDYDISDETLYSVFSQLGEITSHHIIRDATKRSRGFGFMSYKTTEQANRAIIELNGRFIGKKPIVVMSHIKKEQRRMHKQTMKDAIGPPAGQGLGPGQTNPNYPYHQQQSYNSQSHDSSYGSNDSYGGMRGVQHRRPGYDGRDPSFNRPVIGAEYEPHHTNNQDAEYLNQVRKHQQELQTQESIREEYRMRNRQAERRLSPQTQGQFQNLSPRSPLLLSPQLHSSSFRGPMASPSGSNPVGGFHRLPQDNQARALQQIGPPNQMLRSREYEYPHQHTRSQSVTGFPSLNSSLSLSNDRHNSHPPLMLDPEFEPSMRLLSMQSSDMISPTNSANNAALRLNFPHSQPESRRGSQLDMQRHLYPEASRDSSPGRLSLESSTHGFPSSDEFSRHRSLENSSHGFTTNDESYTRSRVGSLDGLGLNLMSGGQSPSVDSCSFSSYFPSGLGPLGSSTSTPGRGAVSSHLGSIVSTHSHSIQSTVNSTRSSSVCNEEECRGSLSDRAYSTVASLALDSSETTNPEEQKMMIGEKLFTLVETFKPFLARSITDYLVNNAPASELLDVLITPDLLLPHYIAQALSMMTVSSSEKA